MKVKTVKSSKVIKSEFTKGLTLDVGDNYSDFVSKYIKRITDWFTMNLDGVKTKIIEFEPTKELMNITGFAPMEYDPYDDFESYVSYSFAIEPDNRVTLSCGDNFDIKEYQITGKAIDDFKSYLLRVSKSVTSSRKPIKSATQSDYDKGADYAEEMYLKYVEGGIDAEDIAAPAGCSDDFWDGFNDKIHDYSDEINSSRKSIKSDYYNNPDRILIGVDICTHIDLFEENYRQILNKEFDWDADGEDFNKASDELDHIVENNFATRLGHQAVEEFHDDGGSTNISSYCCTFWGDKNNQNDIRVLQELQGQADDKWTDNGRIELAIYDEEIYSGGTYFNDFVEKWGDMGAALAGSITIGVSFPEEFDSDPRYSKVHGMSVRNSRQIKSSAGSTDTEQILESLRRSYFPLNDNHTRTCHFVNRNGKWFLILNSAYDFRQNPDLGGNVTINADGSITISGYRTYADVVTNPDCDYARRNIVLGPLSVNITKDELDAIVNKDMGDRSYGSVTPYDKFYNKIRDFFSGRGVYNSRQIKSSKKSIWSGYTGTNVSVEYGPYGEEKEFPFFNMKGYTDEELDDKLGYYEEVKTAWGSDGESYMILEDHAYSEDKIAVLEDDWNDWQERYFG